MCYIIDDNETKKLYGRFSGQTPKLAINKAFTNIIRSQDRNNQYPKNIFMCTEEIKSIKIKGKKIKRNRIIRTIFLCSATNPGRHEKQKKRKKEQNQVKIRIRRYKYGMMINPIVKPDLVKTINFDTIRNVQMKITNKIINNISYTIV